MKIRSLTLVLTDDCNFSCSYCYKKKNPATVRWSLLEEALLFLLPHLCRVYDLTFFGGEPLLAFDLIERTVAFLLSENKKRGKKARFFLTTNGSLLDGSILSFLNKHRFCVVVSFDGMAQETQRNRGSSRLVLSSIESLLSLASVRLEVNSVFGPETVVHLSESLRSIIDAGVSNIHLTLTLVKPWGKKSLERLNHEMERLTGLLVSEHTKTGRIPVLEFREEPGSGVFFCAAGQDRLALTPEGDVWGCDLFPDYFRGKKNSREYRKYFFGDFRTFSASYKDIYPRISSGYAALSMDQFSTPEGRCLFCPELGRCTVCPVHASFSGSPLGKIPSYACTVQKIRIRKKQKFQRTIA